MIEAEIWLLTLPQAMTDEGFGVGWRSLLLSRSGAGRAGGQLGSHTAVQSGRCSSPKSALNKAAQALIIEELVSTAPAGFAA